MLDIIVFGAIGILLCIVFAGKKKEKEKLEKWETVRAEVEAANKTRTEKMLESEFFKCIYARIEEANKKHVLSFIESGHQIEKENAFLAIKITHSFLFLYGFLCGTTIKIDFNELEYKVLSDQELNALADALKSVGYYGQYEDKGYYFLRPIFEYWDEATGGIIEKHNSKFKNVI